MNKTVLNRYVWLRKKYDSILLEELKLKSEQEEKYTKDREFTLKLLLEDKQEYGDLLKINCLILGVPFEEDKSLLN